MADDIPIETFVKDMPKAELHVHIEGCLTPELARKFANRNNLPLPSHLSSLSQQDGYDFHDLASFLTIYYANMSVLITSTDFHDLMYDYLTRAHAQNILHAEIFFDPQAHTSRGISFPTVLLGLRSAIQLAHRTMGMSASLIMCIVRDESANYAMATLISALPFKDSIIGIGLDSNEHDNPPSKFSAVYQRASKEGFLLTAHADIDQKDSEEHVRQLLHEIQIDRLDHGTTIASTPTLLATLLEKRIGLTTCPISNSIVSASSKFPEILSLLRLNALVTINSDDPAYFRGYLNENILKMARETDVSRRELVQMQRNAFGISWISGWKRNHYLQRLEEFEKRNLGSGGEVEGDEGNGVAGVADDGGGDGEGTGSGEGTGRSPGNNRKYRGRRCYYPTVSIMKGIAARLRSSFN